MKLNQFHKVVLADYANGDFADLDYIPDVMRLGDTLLSFILIELSENEGCEDIEDALRRLQRGKEDLDVAVAALERYEHESH